MKKPERSFLVEIDQQAFLGVSPESVLSIKLINNRTGKEPMTYSASVEFVHATLARKHARENPSGKKRRRFFTSSEEMRKFRREHPEVDL
jgi:hypothetical protein